MLLKDYGYMNVAKSISLTHESEAATSNQFSIAGYKEFILFYDATIGLTGGSTPGVTFTLEVDVSGDGEWVAVTTLVTTANGYTAAAVADPTISTTGKNYKYYKGLMGFNARVKYEVSGTPTGGTATINKISLAATN